MTNHELWQAALGEIELNISKTNFITWFRETDILKNADGAISVAVPNAFSKEWLENKYNKLILRALRNISPETKELEFTITAVPSPQGELAVPLKLERTMRKEIEAASQSFQEFEIDKETHLNPKYTF